MMGLAVIEAVNSDDVAHLLDVHAHQVGFIGCQPTLQAKLLGLLCQGPYVLLPLQGAHQAVLRRNAKALGYVQIGFHPLVALVPMEVEIQVHAQDNHSQPMTNAQRTSASSSSLRKIQMALRLFPTPCS